MWILKWLPYWTFYALFFIGLLGYLTTHLLKFIPIPALYIYKTPIQIISIILLVIGVFMAGAIHNEEAWQQKVTELQVKLAEAEAQAANENVKIVEKVVNKTQVVKQKGADIIKYVDKEIVKYDNTCLIPKEFVKAHNDAAEQPK